MMTEKKSDYATVLNALAGAPTMEPHGHTISLCDNRVVLVFGQDGEHRIGIYDSRHVSAAYFVMRKAKPNLSV
jgi:hypothetical protein